MRRSALKSIRTARRLPAAFAAFLAAGLSLSALIGTGCEGTSSGVDNPGLGELTVNFRNAEGSAVRVTGDLDVYGKDQNPALDPDPLATVRIRNSAFTNLTGEDFRRINIAGKAGAATKRGAAGPEASPIDTPMAFNLVFRSDAKTGSLAFGLAYDPLSQTFTRGGSGLARLDIEPRPLVHYGARLKRMTGVHGDVGRVFIPGTPFQATLSDSGFAFEGLPPGVFDLRLLGGDGRIFAVRESLDTRKPLVYHPDTVALGRIDTTVAPNQHVDLSIETIGPAEAFLGMITVFNGLVIGADLSDKRLGVLWRILREQSPDTVGITDPHSLKSQAIFHKVGVYALELAVTLGASVARDTLFIPVREVPAPAEPRLIHPRPGDTLDVGAQQKIVWEMPLPGPVSIQLSTLGGKEGWQVLGDTVVPAAGIGTFLWTPPASLAGSPSCSIRIKHAGPDSLVAQSEGPFSIRPLPAPVK